MTALAVELLCEVSEAGGTVRLERDMLRLSAPEPLPDDLRIRLRQNKAEVMALLAAAEPPDDGAPMSVDDQADRPPRWPTASRRSSTPTGAGAYRPAAGRRSSATPGA